MATCYHYLKRRDTRPGIVATLYETDGTTAYDLTDADEVWMHVRLHTGQTLSREMTIDADPATGKASYLWEATDWTDDPALCQGDHLLEYEVVGPGEARATWPNRPEIEYQHVLRIAAELGQAT
jgi:hypothetical protein